MSRYDPHRHRRRSLRLKGYDYGQEGAYFVTLVTYGRLHLFGEVVAGQMCSSEAGRTARTCWLDIPNHYPHVALDAFVIMPNHVHGIIVITENAGANNNSPLPNSLNSPSKTLGSVIRGYKIGVTKWFRQNSDVYTVWQRNYYEHIVRNEKALERIRHYIHNNPLQWDIDRENINAHKSVSRVSHDSKCDSDGDSKGE